MALVNPYCTVAQVQAEIRNTDSSLTSVLEDSINQISRYIDDYKGRDYFQHDYSVAALELDKYDTDKIVQDTIFLPYTPIIELTSVIVAGTIWVEDEHFIIKDGGDSRARLIAVNQRWLCPTWLPLGPLDKISILGKFGYAQANSTVVPTGIPGFITRAAIIGAAAFTAHNQKEVIGMDGAKTALFDKNLPKNFFDILGPRRTIL